MQCVIRSHDYDIALWRKRSEGSIEGTSGGARAYALRQASLRVHMKKYCERAWQSVDTWLAIGNIGEMDTNLGENEEDECIGGSHISADSLLLGNGWN